MKSDSLERIRKFIIQKGFCQVADVMKKFDYTESTVRCYFGKAGVLSSINFKGKYYVIADNCKFDDNGFLFFDDIAFYEGGSLKSAICRLIEDSPAGLGARELDKFLKTTTHSQLPGYFRAGLLTRKPASCRAGNAYIYFSSDKQKSKAQQELCFTPVPEVVEEPESIEDEELTDVIDVLLTMVSHPGFTAKGVSISLKRRGKGVSRALIDRIFDKYLPVKKKS